MEQKLTKGQLERIERNKQRALILKQSRLINHPYSKGEVVSIDKTTIKIGGTKYKDTGGGFLLEEKDDDGNELVKPTVEDPPILEFDRPICINCTAQFGKSWLFETFDYKVCDDCKSKASEKDEDEFKLITKTEAMKEYLLKECDLDKREPPLKYISKKNPHNVNWGEMKLYLRLQVEERALEVWGSKEKIEEETQKREEKKILSKHKKYQKEMKQLRMNVRSSLFDKTTSSHVHKFGAETYNEDDDTYTHSCTLCEYKETFEKM